MPLLGMEALRLDISLKRRSNHCKVAYFTNRRDQLLARLQWVNDRSDTLLVDRVMDEVDNFQAELQEVAEVRAVTRAEKQAAWEQELAEISLLGIVPPLPPPPPPPHAEPRPALVAQLPKPGPHSERGVTRSRWKDRK
jgi:hypothetical protein